MSDLNQNQSIDEPVDLESMSLDKPPPFDIDWGGDGSDPDRPVRAHVLAALRPSTGPYAPPLDALLMLEAVNDITLAQRAAELQIGQEHVPELVRIVRDRALTTAKGDDLAVLVPIHALHILQHLDISAVVADLIPIFDLDFDIMTDALIETLATAGATALPPLVDYMRDHTRWAWGRAYVTDGLQKIAEQHPETREHVIAILSQILEGAETDHQQVVTGAMSVLIELNAVETLPLIRRAFELGKIDEIVYGPWGEVLTAFGVAFDPGDPLIAESRQRFEEKHLVMPSPDLRDNIAALQERHRPKQQATPQQRNQNQARKQKNKRKAASASRKANRKKRK